MPVDELGRFFVFDLTLFSLFWYAAVTEIPRFLIAALYVAGREVTTCLPRFAAKNEYLKSPPTISVLLPGHNEGRNLERTILGLHEQIVVPHQIVVIDDGSTDDMTKIGQQLKAKGLIDVFMATGLRGGKAAALNLGLTYCTGSIIVISDVDTSFDRDALSKLVEPFTDPRVGAVSGNLGVRNFGATIVARFQAILYLNGISMGRRVIDMLFGLFVASGAFAAFRREALNSVGGWASGPGEDADVTTRLRQAGWAVRFHPDAWALTDVPESTRALVHQRVRWGRSFAMHRLRKHAQIMNPIRANFSLSNALGTIDAIYFEAIRPVVFFVYIVWLVHEYGSMTWAILGFIITVYMIGGSVLFLAAVAVSGDYGRLRLLPYVPGAILFNGFILRPTAVYAYLSELLFRRGYQDSFIPRRVLNRIDRY